MLLSTFSLGRKLDLDWHDVYDRAVDGDLPAPVYVGNRARWRTTDIESWLTAGCPTGSELSDDDYTRLQEVLLSELQEIDSRKETR